ncbi:MAG: hypothetical protein QNL12_00285 [Acidimicrobiia bacterium]|nr:hypothetical protein [Acidimicrobiia bacterium]MDX2465723.1 hypothetical protein [Acidimicrobiia bacterium]
MAEERDRNIILGVTAVVIGLALAIAGALWAHFTGLSAVDNVGRDLYTHIPRGWVWVLLGQLVSLGGVFLAMGGVVLAYLYEKPVTWARASVGAGLFTALMIILFGIIPNEWLTYSQAVWEWTDQKIWVKIPTSLLGGNEVNLSAAVVKDVIAATYSMVAIGGVVVAMIAWQKRDEIRAKREKSKGAAQNVSAYGRPLRKVER